MSTTQVHSLINGREATHIALSDRGLNYGDGLFETLAVVQGRARHWERHMARLGRGCERLGLPTPDLALLDEEAKRLCQGAERGVLKLLLTRGSGGRGYQPPDAVHPTRILSLYPNPAYPVEYARQGIRAHLCETRLARNPRLAGIKHLNRLEQVLARAELAGDYAEGVMCDTQGQVISGTMSNLFIVEEGTLVTPLLDQAGIEGITRERILESAALLGIPACIEGIDRQRLESASAIFFCNSVMGIWPVGHFAHKTYKISPLLRTLMRAERDEDSV